MIGINTPESALKTAKKQNEYNVNYRRKILTEGANVFLDTAYRRLEIYSVAEFPTNSAEFEFSQYFELSFPEWQVFAESDEYPERPNKRPQHMDDYLESRVAYLFWRVFEQLVNEEAFSLLNLASPTRLGFAFHEGPDIVLHLINWNEKDTE